MEKLPTVGESCKGVWSRDERQYADRFLYKLGKIVVGQVDHPTVSRGEPRKARAVILLPGMSLGSPDYPTDEEAKARVEKAVSKWFEWCFMP